MGLILPDGGKEHLPKIRALVQLKLGWDDARWKKEERAYKELVGKSYSLEGK
jgi:glycerol-3-phosphate dehydrogenase